MTTMFPLLDELQKRSCEIDKRIGSIDDERKLLLRELDDLDAAMHGIMDRAEMRRKLYAENAGDDPQAFLNKANASAPPSPEPGEGVDVVAIHASPESEDAPGCDGEQDKTSKSCEGETHVRREHTGEPADHSDDERNAVSGGLVEGAFSVSGEASDEARLQAEHKALSEASLLHAAGRAVHASGPVQGTEPPASAEGREVSCADADELSRTFVNAPQLGGGEVPESDASDVAFRRRGGFLSRLSGLVRTPDQSSVTVTSEQSQQPPPPQEQVPEGETRNAIGPADERLTKLMEQGGRWHDGGGNPAPGCFVDIYVPAKETNLGDEALFLEGQPSNAYLWNGWEVAYRKTGETYAGQLRKGPDEIGAASIEKQLNQADLAMTGNAIEDPDRDIIDLREKVEEPV